MPGGRLPPLARAMREFTQIQIAEGRPVSFEEAVDRVDRGSITRRELFRAGGAIGAGLVLAACAPGSKPSATSKPAGGGAVPAKNGPLVAVVGAGLAGCTAAYRLTQAGVSTQLFESRDRIGGRCWTARGFADGQTAEHGGEFIDTRHVHLLHLAHELGLKVDDLWKGWLPGFTWLTFVNGKLAAYKDWKDKQQPISDAVTKMARDVGTFKNGKATTAAYSYGTATTAAKAMDEMSMSEWLDEQVPGVTGSPFGSYMDEVMASWYGLNMNGLSALNWIDFYVIPWPGADERWHIHGGNDQVPTLIQQALPEGTLHLSAPLELLVKRSDGRFELRFGGNESSKPVIADYVILTVPFTTLRKVDLSGAGFGAQRMDAIQNQGMGTDVKLLLQYDRRPNTWKTPAGIWSGGMEQADAQFETWESSVDEPGKAGLITVYAGGRGSDQFAAPDYHAVPPAAMVTATLGHINDAVPGTAAHHNGHAWLDYWTGDPWTLGSYAAFMPGQMTKYWGYTGRPEGRIHFAGELTSTYSQGYLNGGVESGQRTAIEVMRSIGVPVPKSIASLPYSTFAGY